jgi:hypothetical protein
MEVNVFGLRFDPEAMPATWLEVLEGAFATSDPMERTVTLLASGIPAFVAAALLGLAFGSGPARIASLMALGVVPFVVAFLLHVDSHHPLDCHDCYEALGGAYHPSELYGAIFNVVGWTAGVAVGRIVARAAAHLYRDMHPRRPAASRP